MWLCMYMYAGVHRWMKVCDWHEKHILGAAFGLNCHGREKWETELGKLEAGLWGSAVGHLDWAYGELWS